MIEALKQQLEELTSLTGVSGREDEVIRYMHAAFSATTDDVVVDMLGNVTAAYRSGRKDAQKLMFFAHMDEVGLMVKRVEPDGFLRMERFTAVNSHIIPGTVFHVRTQDGALVRGVVGAKAHHFMSAAEKERMPELSDLYLDIGAKSRQEAEALGITPGCVIAFRPEFSELQNNLVASKSLDDRVGLLALLGLASHLKGKKLHYDVFLVASVQEEFNIRGIMPASRAIDPDVAIGIDITPTSDTPDTQHACDIRIGGGPAFTYYNYHGRGTLNGIIPNEALVHFLERAATQANIPFQREVSRGLLTETSYVAISGCKGVASANISIPSRYAHTPVEVASMEDIAATIQLLRQFADTWDPSYCLKKLNL